MRLADERIIAGFLSGMLGNIPKTLVCRFFKYQKISRLVCSDMLAGVFLPAKSLKTKQCLVFSIIADFLVAGLNGIGFKYVLKLSGKSHAIWKGLAAGLFSFGFYRGFVVKFGRGKVYSRHIPTNMVMALTSSIWGMSTAFFNSLFEKRRINHALPYNYKDREGLLYKDNFREKEEPAYPEYTLL